MSLTVRCPSCDQSAKDNAYPDVRWGKLFNGSELDRAIEPSPNEDVSSYVFPWDAGRQTFECPCGRALWVADRLTSAGHWFINATTQEAARVQQ